MRLSDAIVKAHEKNWSFTNTFSIQIHVDGNSQLKGLQFLELKDEINMHIASVDLPDIQGTQIEEFVVDRFRLGISADQPYRFSINFIDYNQMEIWRSFIEGYNRTKENYFDNIKLSVKIFKEPDVTLNSEEGDLVHLITFKEAMIESVGRFSLSNEDEAQIQKFSIQFKSSVYDTQE